jgi:phosphoribosylformimino-5-aminoimidazole carboxamide ribotide isomerase
VIVLPAIDVRAGKVVRLKQGQLQQETVYGSDPAELARHWATAGAERLHLVDLDAALQGRPQADILAAVIRVVRIPVEVGGGLRSFDDARRWRELGAERVIFGTAAISNPEAVERAAREWPGAVCVALDARDGKVAVAGWQEITRVGALELALRVKALGVTRVQFTDVVRDGTLSGPNLAATEQLARDSGLRVTASGGVSTLDDLRRLRPLEACGVDEVIVGKALYERRFSLAEARAALRGEGAPC